jgi:hypothetical protein
MDFTLTNVSDTPTEWGEGTMKTYYYQVKGTYAGVEKSTSIGVKDTSRAPKVGDVLFGHWETKGDKEKFVKDPRPPQPTTGATQAPLFNGNHKDTASIERQVSLKCAVEFAGYVLNNMDKRTKDSGMTSADVLLVAEAFDAYLKGEKAHLKLKHPVEGSDTQQHPSDEPQVHPSDIEQMFGVES